MPGVQAGHVFWGTQLGYIGSRIAIWSGTTWLWSSTAARCLFQFRCLNFALWTWYCNNVFLRTLNVWNGLSIINSFSLLDPRGKTWIVRVLPWGVLNGTIRYSLLSGCLVSGGRRAPLKVCYFGRFCHRDVLKLNILFWGIAHLYPRQRWYEWFMGGLILGSTHLFRVCKYLLLYVKNANLTLQGGL